MRTIFIAVILSCTSVFAAQSVQLTPVRLSPGSPVLLEITAADASGIDGSLGGEPVRFFAGPNHRWYALAGIDVETPVAPVKLELTVHLTGGGSHALAEPIPLVPANYRTATITVAPKFVTPPPQAEEEIAEERALKEKLFGEANAHVEEEPAWSGEFCLPIHSQPTDSFGTRRVVKSAGRQQEQIESIHKGMDFRAPSGTSVHAANAGTVLLARHLYYEGNCVIIDHGFGLYTLYMHLSQFSVHAGERVKSGQLLGLSGATGRVTGPHLHWAVRYRDVYLDPGKLLQLPLPATGNMP